MTSLSLSKVNQTYFDKLFVAKNNTQLSAAIRAKVLLVDQHTMPIISMSYTQSQLLQKDVVLIEMLDNLHNLSTMKHLNCVVYVKPTKELISKVCEELLHPHYNHYQLFFNNSISKNDIEKLAEADEQELVNQVIELYQDYSIVNDNLYTLTIPEPSQVSRHTLTIQEATSLVSVLLSLKKCPLIKYEASSLDSKRLASEILYYINSNLNNNLFDDLNRTSDVPPTLLILDRKSDPITPLVLPWTYQSMIHELIGINRNVVDLKESNEQLTLSESQDKFFQETMYMNYGDLTDRFQKYVDEYKKQTKQTSIENLKTQDLSEFKKILTKFPEFKKLSNNILKHLNIISEIDKQISRQNLWAVGELQQTIACDLENYQTIKTKLIDLIADHTVTTQNKVKLLLLYVAKFPNKQSDLGGMLAKLNDPVTTSPPPTITQTTLIKQFGRYFGSIKKLSSLESSNNTNGNIGQLFNKNRIKIQQLFNSNNDNDTHSMPKTDNIFMQYIPKLNDILAQITNPTPQKGPGAQHHLNQNPDQVELATMAPDVVTKQYGESHNQAAQEVIIYFKGGATYEEARLVHELSKVNTRVKYIIGGDGILNSSQWLERMSDIVNGYSESAGPGEPASHGDRRSQLREIL